MNQKSFSWRLFPGREFASIASQWDDLNEAGASSPLLTSTFVSHLLTHFGTGREKIALYESEGRLKAICVIGSGTSAPLSFQPSQAPIGLYVQEQTDGLDHNALRQLIPALGIGSVMFGLMQLDPELLPRPVDQSLLETNDYIRTGRITITGSFEDYWAARGKNLRSNMKKQRNKLEGEGIVTRLECLTRPEDVAAGIAEYGRLEAAGWKSAGGTAISADNQQGRFYRALLEDYCARGWGRIYRYWFNDKVVAVDLCVACGGTMVILKTTIDETIKGVSPAFLMRHEYLPEIFARQEFARVEFYGRMMDWHTKWTDEFRTLYHVNVFRWPFVQRLYTWRQERLHQKAREQDKAQESASAAVIEEAPQGEKLS